MKKILSNFQLNGEIISIIPIGNGHINDTFLVTCNNNNQYLLQKINDTIFKDVDKLMNNILLITSFLKEKICNRGQNYLKNTLNLVLTKDNNTYFYDKLSKKYFRVYIYINNSITYQIAPSPIYFKEAAKAFANFIKDLIDFDLNKLNIIINDFHNTNKRYIDFLNTIKNDKYNRVKDCQEEIDFIIKRNNYYNIILSLINKNKIPIRITHNDTKLNNVLFDKNSKQALCVIDLDTIMPGSILYDFGDAIRYGCNNAYEDEKDLQKITFNIENFKAYVSGFLEITNDILTNEEINNLAFSALLITMEQAIRFLDDYLNGDIYFKISYAKHNLIRAKNQLKLAYEIEKNMDKMNEIIHIELKKI